MGEKIIKASLYIIGGIFTLVFGIVAALWIISPGKADPITDPQGNLLEGSISVINKITLGGDEQYLIIRGADSTKPVMLFLHGGPGSPETAFMKHFNRDIEKDFVMVYWEQRGAGKSWSKDIPAESMNMAQFVSDTRELSEYLAERFSQERIYIMGHSWGSLLGMLTAYEHPELFRAFFGIGQACYQFKGEQISFEWVKEQARKNNDNKSIEALDRLTFPDSLANSDIWIDYLMNQRKYVNEFGGGTTRDMTGMWPLIKIVMKTSEYTTGEKLNFMTGSMFSLEHMWNEVINANLLNDIDSMQVPVYIFHGKHDYTTPYSVAKEFYNQLKAPEKGFFTFENSAHSPVMEEVEKFNSIVKEITMLHPGTHGSYQLQKNPDLHSPAFYGTGSLKSLPGSLNITEDRIKNFPSGQLNGIFTLEKYIIDTVISEGDGQSLADISGDGTNNLIVGTGTSGEVYWYERIAGGKWQRHLIAKGYRKVEGTIAGDFNGNGQIEVIILDQRGNKVDIAQQATDDPRKDWLTLTLDPDASFVQQGQIMDVTGNGNPDFIYAYEGSSPGDGGFYWMENKGGNLLDPDNWEKHEILQIEGAWWIDYNSPRNWGGYGTGDIAVGVREVRGRNPGSVNGGIYILKQPVNPRDRWIKEAVDTSFPVLQVSSGDLTGNGDKRDLVAGACHDSEHTGLYIYDHSNRWQRVEVENRHNWWGTYAFDINNNGRAEIISGERSGNTIRIYAYNDALNRYVLKASDPFLKPDDQIIFDDIDGNGNKTEFFVGSDPDGIFWYRAFRLQ